MRLRPDVNPDPLFSSGIFSSRRPTEKMPDQQRGKNISSNRRKFVGPKPSSARSSFSASRADRVCSRVSFITSDRARSSHIPHEHHLPVKMAAMSAVAPVLNKAPVVSTGKAANTIHDGVAAPATSEYRRRAAPRSGFPDSRDDRGARSLSMRRDLARSLPRKRSNHAALGGRARARAARSSRSAHASSAGPAGGINAARSRPTWQVILYAR